MSVRESSIRRRAFFSLMTGVAAVAFSRSAFAEDDEERSLGNTSPTPSSEDVELPAKAEALQVDDPYAPLDANAAPAIAGDAPTPAPRVVRPALKASRVREVVRDERGTTLTLELLRAPFPAPGAFYDDPTVVVFVPSYYRTPKTGRSDVVVHFHGHHTTTERSMRAHDLREQLFDSKQNAILVLPQGPVMAADSSIGKLEAPGGFSRFLTDVMATLQTKDAKAALARASTKVGRSVGTVCLSGHSGGYHAIASCVKHGGVAVREVYLFDALYGDEDTFRTWLLEGKKKHERRKLVSYCTGGTTVALSERLFGALEKAGLRCARERTEGTLSRASLTVSDAVLIRTAIGHTDVPNESNGLRDCLYASGLTRHLRSSWFEKKSGARPVDRRR